MNCITSLRKKLAKLLVLDIFLFEHRVQKELPLELRLNNTDLTFLFFMKCVEMQPFQVVHEKHLWQTCVKSESVVRDVF